MIESRTKSPSKVNITKKTPAIKLKNVHNEESNNEHVVQKLHSTKTEQYFTNMLAHHKNEDYESPMLVQSKDSNFMIIPTQTSTVPTNFPTMTPVKHPANHPSQFLITALPAHPPAGFQTAIATTLPTKMSHKNPNHTAID